MSATAEKALPSVRLARIRARHLVECPHVRTLNLERRLHAELLDAMAAVLAREPEALP